MTECPKPPHELFEDDVLIDGAMAAAAREARRRHKLAGVPLVVWQDGRVVHIPPDQIVVDEQEQATITAANLR